MNNLHKDRICTGSISNNNRNYSTIPFIFNESNITQSDNNHSYFDHHSLIHSSSRIPQPNVFNLLACDSLSSSPYRRSRADQEDDDDDFAMVTNKRRLKVDKNNSIEDEYNDEVSENNQSIGNHHKQYQHHVTEATYAHPTSKSHQNAFDYESDQQHPTITSEATRHAKARFPFTTFTIRLENVSQ